MVYIYDIYITQTGNTALSNATESCSLPWRTKDNSTYNRQPIKIGVNNNTNC